MLYCNDGDWVESLTALVEHADGRLEILDRSRTARTPQTVVKRGLRKGRKAAAGQRADETAALLDQVL